MEQLVNHAAFSGVLKDLKLTWQEASVRFVGVVSACCFPLLANIRRVGWYSLQESHFCSHTSIPPSLRILERSHPQMLSQLSCSLFLYPSKTKDISSGLATHIFSTWTFMSKSCSTLIQLFFPEIWTCIFCHNFAMNSHAPRKVLANEHTSSNCCYFIGVSWGTTADFPASYTHGRKLNHKLGSGR